MTLGSRPTPRIEQTPQHVHRPDDEEAEESTPWAEQQTWEALQIANASMKTGAKAGRKGGKQYDLVFADQIDFVTNEVLAGTICEIYSVLDLQEVHVSMLLRLATMSCGSAVLRGEEQSSYRLSEVDPP